MEKRERIVLFIIIAIMIVGTVVILTQLNFNDADDIKIRECQTDSDCVPSSCCHSYSCVPISFRPNCQETFCSSECTPGTLDCGQGSCLCQNGKCQAVFN